MQQLMLNTGWTMQRCGDNAAYHCTIPCSVYHTLYTHGQIEEPYYRDNERDLLSLAEEDYCFATTFPRPTDARGRICLCFDGIDTVADIMLNGEFIGHTDNMHRRWRFDVTHKMADENLLEVTIYSPLKYIARKQAEHPLWGVDSTVAGFPHIRKAHYMFGWDWGPKLPDLGIWRDVYLEIWDKGRIESVQYMQEHKNGIVELTVHTEIRRENRGLHWAFALYDPDGERVAKSEPMSVKENSVTVRIEDPKLWWARGYGEQNLYTAVVLLTEEDGSAVDSRTERIGLRTLTIRQEPDKWGESFCLRLNGRDIFAMGANWIPMDNLLPRCTPRRQEELLQSCVDANFNVIRVWGGGYYPDDAFYDFCDENGLIVWQDFMFACANYHLTDEFWMNVEEELRDNIMRLRNHASLGLWCGNNEIETAFETWGLPENPEAKADYLDQFEDRMPAIAEALDPQRFYWRSSPSAHGGCVDTASNEAGDMHYWDVWHGLQPFTAFRKLYYRFCSEYGFESMPCKRTMLTVCDPEKGDLNLMSPIMELHHKCDGGSAKMLYYLAQMMRYPMNFDEIVFATQYVQAEYLRSAVEHMRRHRGRCMGSIYWQLGDSNPAVSWSSVDYYGRWKAAHYYAKRFYAPILLTAGAGGDPMFNISNETLDSFAGKLIWEIRDNHSKVCRSGSFNVHVPALSSKFFERIRGLGDFYTEENRRTHYLSYRLERDGAVVSSGVTLLCLPKQFIRFKPHITLELRKLPEHYILNVRSDVFVPAVALDCRTIDIPFSDNWFPIHANEPINVYIPKRPDLTLDLLREEIFAIETDL